MPKGYLGGRAHLPWIKCQNCGHMVSLEDAIKELEEHMRYRNVDHQLSGDANEALRFLRGENK